MFPTNQHNHGLPVYSHQSYSHLVGICNNDEGLKYDTVTFPPSSLWVRILGESDGPTRPQSIFTLSKPAPF